MLMGRYLKIVMLVMAIVSSQACAAIQWKTFKDPNLAYSIRYPEQWHLYTKKQIQATVQVSGQGGPLPVFAVQAPDRSSFYLVVDKVDPLSKQATKEEQQEYLQNLYMRFCGQDLAKAGCKRISKKGISLADEPAIEYVWRYPRMQGIILVNKHWCFSKGSVGFFLAATTTNDDFPERDKRFFAPMVRSLTLTDTEEKIAFRSERDGNWEIYTMNVDGSNVTRLTKNQAKDDTPRWSPDGQHIVFRSERDGNQEIYIMNSDGSEQHRLTRNSVKDSNPCFCPDGSRILFASKRSGGWELYTMKPDGTDQKRLTDKKLDSGGGRYSLDGKKIVFTSPKDGNFDVYVMDVDGTNVSRLTRNPALETGPVFSPNGHRIMFTSTRDGNYEIYLINTDGSGLENVTKHHANDAGGGFVDENNIVFFSDRTGDIEIYKMHLNTKVVSRITNSPGSDTMADIWVPRGDTQ